MVMSMCSNLKETSCHHIVASTNQIIDLPKWKHHRLPSVSSKLASSINNVCSLCVEIMHVNVYLCMYVYDLM